MSDPEWDGVTPLAPPDEPMSDPTPLPSFLSQTGPATLWTLEAALPVVRACEPIAKPFGYHVALGGSVLLAGRSSKDLDIMFYPHGIAGSGQAEKLLNALPVSGVVPLIKMEIEKYPLDWIWRAEYCGKRVDIFILDRRPKLRDELLIPEL